MGYSCRMCYERLQIENVQYNILLASLLKLLFNHNFSIQPCYCVLLTLLAKQGLVLLDDGSEALISASSWGEEID